jgi:hypothetical protein
MPINGCWLKLSLDNIEAVPRVAGVYEIATLVRTTLFIGRSAGKDIRSCLSSELSDPASQIRQRTLYFRYEQTSRDDQRHRDLLEEYAQQHCGQQPPLNQRADRGRAHAKTGRPARAADHRHLRAVS